MGISKDEFDAQLSAYRGELIARNTLTAINKVFIKDHRSSMARSKCSIREMARKKLEWAERDLNSVLDSDNLEGLDSALFMRNIAVFELKTGKDYFFQDSHVDSDCYKKRLAIALAKRYLINSIVNLINYQKPYKSPEYQALGYAKCRIVFEVPSSDELIDDAICHVKLCAEKIGVQI